MPDSKSATVVEYVGAEVTEAERQKDIVSNPHVCQYHRFAFDHIYDINSSQSFVYENTAKSAVMSSLEVKFLNQFIGL